LWIVILDYACFVVKSAEGIGLHDKISASTSTMNTDVVMNRHLLCKFMSRWSILC